MSEHVIEENDSERRLDRILRRFLPDASLSLIYSSIRKGLIRLNGKKTKPETKTSLGDVLYIAESLEVLKKKEKASETKIKHFDILLKTKDLLFLNKKAGSITHGKNSIDEDVKSSFNRDSSLSFSVGALHRLDKETTGVLTFSQSLKGASTFSKALVKGEIARYYVGINEGHIKEGVWNLPSKHLNKKHEITLSFLIEYSKKENLSLSFYKLITGKKHQIRHGSEHFGTPLFCDTRYGSKRKDYPSYFLHSVCLNFEKPIFGDVPSFVVAPIPSDFFKLIKTYFPSIHKKIEDNGIESIVKKWIALL